MKTTSKIKRMFSLFLCIVLIAAMALFTAGCDENKTDTQHPEITVISSDLTQLGQGKTKFYFYATGLDGKTASFEISTDKALLGEALTEINMISGEQGDYGLYVKTVNGVFADADKGEYWILYVGGESSMTGVDQVKITDSETYEFKIEKY